MFRLLFLTSFFWKSNQLSRNCFANDRCVIAQKQHTLEFLLICTIELQNIDKVWIEKASEESRLMF